jgi:hypothetical protein
MISNITFRRWGSIFDKVSVAANLPVIDGVFDAKTFKVQDLPFKKASFSHIQSGKDFWHKLPRLVP